MKLTLFGEILDTVTVADGKDRIDFVTRSGRHFVMHHVQDCCESVLVEDVCGDWNDIIGQPLTQAYEETNRNETADWRITWTFYRFATAKGQVVVRWKGESNGYYSEAVSLVEIEK